MSWIENIKTVTAGKINKPGEEKAWLSCEGWTPRRQEQMGISGLKWTPSWTIPPNCLPCEEVGGWRHPWGVTVLEALLLVIAITLLNASCSNDSYFTLLGGDWLECWDALECGYHLYQQLMFIHIICSGVTVSDAVTCSLFYGTQQLIKGTLHSYGTLLFSSDDWLDYTNLQFITLWRVIKMWGRPFVMNIYWKIFSFTFFVSNFHSDMHAMTETGWFGMWSELIMSSV